MSGLFCSESEWMYVSASMLHQDEDLCSELWVGKGEQAARIHYAMSISRV